MQTQAKEELRNFRRSKHPVWFKHPKEENECLIVQKEQRIQVIEFTYPYSTIGLIYKYQFEEGKDGKRDKIAKKGTGFLIHPHVVMTCAHNLSGENFSKVEFIVQTINTKIKCTIRDKSKIFYPSQFDQKKQGEQKKFDFALILLDENLSDECGYIGTHFLADKEIMQQQKFQICGFPGYIGINQEIKVSHEGSEEMYYSPKTYQLNPLTLGGATNLVQYEIPTSKGQSGSPIFYSIGQQYLAVGIHTNGVESLSNYGVLLNQSLNKRINQYMSKIPIKPVVNIDLNSIIEKNIKDQPMFKQFQKDANELKLSWEGLDSTNLKQCLQKLMENRELKSLTISNYNLSEVPTKINELKNLTTLNLAYNNIKSIPSNLFKKKSKITCLILTNNNLQVIPHSIERLENLRELSVSRNPGIDSIPEEICSLKELQVLRANKCRIHCLPKGFSSLKNLSHLQISFNCLRGGLIETRLQCIAQLHKLKIFAANNNKLTQHPDFYSEHKSIRQIDISKNQIKELKFGRCIDANVQILNFQDNEINLEKIPKILWSRLKYTLIFLSGNLLGNYKNVTQQNKPRKNVFLEMKKENCKNILDIKKKLAKERYQELSKRA